MLSNAYFLAKFGFDTAENEPAKKLQKYYLQCFLKKKIILLILLRCRPEERRPRLRPHRAPGPPAGRLDGLRGDAALVLRGALPGGPREGPRLCLF